MARYASFLYGTTLYGDVPVLDYSVEPMSMLALDFTRVKVTWSQPTGDFTRMRLVRSQSGDPETVSDGITIWESVQGDSRTQFIDGQDNPTDTPLIGGEPVYYTFFLFTTDKVWVKAGKVSGVIPLDHDLHNTLISFLPRMYTSVEQSPLNEPNENSDLYRFLKGFSFTAESFLTYLDLIRPGTLVTYSNVGMSPEPNLPTRNQRALIREAIRMYSLKGTPKGLEAYAESLTGFAPTLTITTGATPSVDVFLDAPRANYIKNPSFEAGFADWTLAGSATISQSTDVADTAFSGIHSAQIVATGNWTLTSNLIPIDVGTFYTVSALAKTTANLQVAFIGRDSGGTITETSDTYPLGTLPTWTRVSGTELTDAIDHHNVATYEVVFSGGAGTFLLDCVMVEESFKMGEYIDGALPADSGVVWSGTAHDSVSYEYPNMALKFSRLANTIQDWIPPNVDWRILSRRGVEATS